ncbi:glycoside hydrolase family 3 protein [Herbiconiux sp. VKM Ac-2851]|uniref:glycoside hydrolase family 3 protein n=1 Tax=Herbiconiux sp. VKM Ac-2851 TaxID=2739025 RepID=UPI001564F820|nr:glycoside hydrolase family 3 protein [Herbiconiux sp. VKM Ac-2851]NQX36204.1 glycoside hydrolase family 3 protein [Herbiconiux sp. VKM Ac-2851]
MSGLRSSILGTLLPGFEGTILPEWVERMLGEGLAGVCLFGENIVSPAQLRALTDAIRAANPSALIAIDEEGGDVTRLFYDRGAPYPGNAVLGRLDDLAATRAVGAAVGRALAGAGVNLDFAPDADVNSNPLNPVIGVRSFGADPALAARHTVAWTEGLQAQGVAACLKHFPGHGDTAQDSHLALPTVDAPADVLRSRELVPFAAAVAAVASGASGALTVMTSHIVLSQLDPGTPATFSRPILEGILRGELGFEGVIVTDALDMAGASGSIGIPAAAVAALAAGCDLLCIGTKNTGPQLDGIVDAVQAAVDAGSLAASRVEEAAGRNLALAAWAGTSAIPASSGAVGSDEVMPDARAVASTFSWTAEADEALTGPGWTVVRVDTAANSAIGVVPWGPFAALAAAGVHLGVHEVVEASWREEIEDIPAEAYVLVIGKDNERRPEVVALIDTLRVRHPRVVTVDMGWPGGDPRYAGVATYGASALVGEALAGVLAERGVRS